jgi:(2Fe-2S) ferredoxin
MVRMSQYTAHVFVCTFGPWCRRDGDTEEIVKQLKRSAHAAGLKGRVRINKAGCLNQCGHGPMVVVYPAGHWYAGVTAADADDIVQQDILIGGLVERLHYQAPPGDNKDLARYPPELVAEEQAKKQD